MCLEVEQLSHKLVPFFIFWGTSKLTSTMDVLMCNFHQQWINFLLSLHSRQPLSDILIIVILTGVRRLYLKKSVGITVSFPSHSPPFKTQAKCYKRETPTWWNWSRCWGCLLSTNPSNSEKLSWDLWLSLGPLGPLRGFLSFTSSPCTLSISSQHVLLSFPPLLDKTHQTLVGSWWIFPPEVGLCTAFTENHGLGQRFDIYFWPILLPWESSRSVCLLTSLSSKIIKWSKSWVLYAQ